jgi:hypothetical protein
MMSNINMKVNPLYSDVDLSIQFHFEFIQGENKIGESLVSTYMNPNEQNEQQKTNTASITFIRRQKCAVIDRFEIINDSHEYCMNKLKHFLQVIGIKEVHAGYDLKVENTYYV